MITKRIAQSIAFAASLVAFVPAQADAKVDPVHTVNQYRECWYNNTTFFHVSVFNETKYSQTVKVEWSRGTERYADTYTMPKHQGVLTGIRIKPNSEIRDVTIRWNNQYIYYRTLPVRALDCK